MKVINLFQKYESIVDVAVAVYAFNDFFGSMLKFINLYIKRKDIYAIEEMFLKYDNDIFDEDERIIQARYDKICK